MQIQNSQDFAQSIYTMARDLGLDDAQARLAAAQASLETGFGRKAPGNNYFGIKAGSSWQGPTQSFRTWEEVGGKRQNITDRFRSYDDPQDSLRDWVSLMERRWPDALTATTFEDAAKGLRYGERGGYATDSRYGAKLGAINERVSDAFGIYDSTRLANYAADQEENIGQQAFQDLLNPTQRFEQVAGLNYEALPTSSAKPASAMVDRQTAPIPETTRGLMAALGSPSPQARPAETRVDSVAAEIPRSTGGLLAALGAPAAPMTQPGNANQRVAGAFSMFDQPAPLDALPTGTTIPSRSIASPLEAAPEAAIATNNSPQSVGRATKQKDEEDGKGKIGWSPFVGAALGSLVGSPMLGAALGAAYGAGKLPSFGGLFDAIPGVNVPFATAEGFNQTQWGQARNAGFVDGQYNSDRAVDAGLFAGDLSASDWASRSALDQRDRAAAGEKTWADAFGGLFG